MAQGTDHIIAGITVGLAYVYLFRAAVTSFWVFIVLVMCAVAGSLFPDIDVKSKGQKLFYGIMAPGYIVLFANGQYLLCFLVGLCALLPIMCTHRGLYHRWWFVIAFTGLWGLAIMRIFPQYADLTSMSTILFILGSLSHLWLDFGLFKMFVK